MALDENSLLLLVMHKNLGRDPSQQTEITREEEFVHFASENLAGNSEAIMKKAKQCRRERQETTREK